MAENVRLLTLNAQHATPDGNYKSKGDVQLLAKELVRLNPAIATVQELDRYVRRSGRKIDQVAVVESETGMQAAFAEAGRFRGQGRVGHAIFVRGKVLKRHVFPLE